MDPGKKTSREAHRRATLAGREGLSRGAGQRVGWGVRLGLVSDLHGRFDPLLPKVLEGVELILLAGDTVDERLLPRLRRVAPVAAIRGNNDHGPILGTLPEVLDLDLNGNRVPDDPRPEGPALARRVARVGPEILIVGHSHHPLIEREGRLLVVNPGSAGPKRFALPRTAGTLELWPAAGLRRWRCGTWRGTGGTAHRVDRREGQGGVTFFYGRCGARAGSWAGNTGEWAYPGGGAPRVAKGQHAETLRHHRPALAPSRPARLFPFRGRPGRRPQGRPVFGCVSRPSRSGTSRSR